MKAKVARNISGDMVAKRAPAMLRDQVMARQFGNDGGLFTLLTFSLSKKSPVFSGAVANILGSLSPGERLVVFGYDFTLEALALFEPWHAAIFSETNFLWTEESYTRVRNAIASPKKYPAR